MKIKVIVIVGLILLANQLASTNPLKANTKSANHLLIRNSTVLYKQLQLSKLGLKPEVFEKALLGWKAMAEQHLLNKSRLLSIVDLSQSSTHKRLYIIDMEKEKVAYHTYVAHGRNSGEEYARAFSNTPESFQSSLGFYLTGETYQGKHGFSLRLKGLEQGINHLAEERSIVMHGANYVSEAFIKQTGRLGRSQGCPAVCEALSTPIINLIKQGSCLFIYYPDTQYLKKSHLLRQF
ncbi:MAG: murein L,D-transpeptidase catalytic domain family protein [Bacteroidota bacterium]